MKTIVISDTALLGITLDDTVKGIKLLKDHQELGSKIIVLSNNCENNIHNYIVSASRGIKATREEVSNIYTNTSGIKFMINHDLYNFQTLSLIPDYVILGNGEKIINDNNEVIYDDSFIEQELLLKVGNKLQEFSYSNNPIRNNDSAYCFLTENGETNDINNDIYGIKCPSRGYVLDSLVISEVEKSTKKIKGYLEDNNLYFYKKEMNKLKCLREIFKLNPNMNINDVMLILDNATDDVLIREFPYQSYCLNSMLTHDKSIYKASSLYSVLTKVK